MAEIFDLKEELKSLKDKNKAFEDEIVNLDKFQTQDFKEGDYEVIQRCMDRLNEMNRLQHIIRISAFHSQKRTTNG